jgi:hypothetical protein
MNFRSKKLKLKATTSTNARMFHIENDQQKGLMKHKKTSLSKATHPCLGFIKVLNLFRPVIHLYFNAFKGS